MVSAMTYLVPLNGRGLSVYAVGWGWEGALTFILEEGTRVSGQCANTLFSMRLYKLHRLH